MHFLGLVSSAVIDFLDIDQILMLKLLKQGYVASGMKSSLQNHKTVITNYDSNDNVSPLFDVEFVIRLLRRFCLSSFS